MAGVTEMSYLHFLLSIFIGRMIRFLVLAGMIIAYGPEILHFIIMSCRHHLGATFGVVALLIVLAGVVVYFVRSRVRAEANRETTVV